MNGAEISTAIRSIIKGYEKYLDDAGDSCGLNRTERDSLLFLYNNQGYDTARDIVEYRMIPKANVSQAVESLIAKGYLEREACISDRRRIHLCLTPSGQSVASKLKESQKRFCELLFDGLSAEERDVLEKANHIIMKNTRKILNEMEYQNG